MDNQSELKKLHDKLYLAYHQDGIVDMAIGMCATGFAIFMATELVALLILAWLPMILYIPMKQAITRPRLGYIRFTPESVSTKRYIISALLGLLVLAVFITLRIIDLDRTSAEYVAWMRQYHIAVYGGILGLVAAGVALFTGLKRFYLYGLLAFLLPVGAALADLPTYLPVLVVGLLLVGNGILMAARFMRSYPVAEKE